MNQRKTESDIDDDDLLAGLVASLLISGIAIIVTAVIVLLLFETPARSAEPPQSSRIQSTRENNAAVSRFLSNIQLAQAADHESTEIETESRDPAPAPDLSSPPAPRQPATAPLMPPAVKAVATAAPGTADGLLSVKIAGPKHSMIGKMARLSLHEIGDVRDREWSIDPPVDDWFISPDGTAMFFVTPNPGRYEVMASIAGMSGGKIKSKHATWSIEIVERLPDDDEPDRGGRSSKARTRSAGTITPEEIVRRAIPDERDLAENSSLLGEAAIVARAFRSAAGPGKSGLLSEARVTALDQLPDGGKAWRQFFTDVENLFGEFADEGLLKTKENRLGSMVRVAEILESLE